jgi:hypothetical protein
MRRRALSFAVNRVIPVAVYHGLRAAGVGVYLALLADALVPAAFTAYQFARGRTLDGLGLFMTGMLGIGVAVALLLDAGARVLIAYVLPVDLVRVTGAGLYVAVTLLTMVITNVHYFATGLFNGWSRLYAPLRGQEPPHPAVTQNA